MIIRIGFISNSSSTSFIAIGTKIKENRYKEILEKIQEKYFNNDTCLWEIQSELHTEKIPFGFIGDECEIFGYYISRDNSEISINIVEFFKNNQKIDMLRQFLLKEEINNLSLILGTETH